MAMSLGNKQGESFSFSNLEWVQILSLAKIYGWLPSGTKYPYLENSGSEICNLDTSEWPGSYTSHDGQLVTLVDAQNIANAPEKVLERFSDYPSEYLDNVPIDDEFNEMVAVMEGLVSKFKHDPTLDLVFYFLKFGKIESSDLFNFVEKRNFGYFDHWLADQIQGTKGSAISRTDHQIEVYLYPEIPV